MRCEGSYEDKINAVDKKLGLEATRFEREIERK